MSKMKLERKRIAIEIVLKCCIEFIKLLASESNDICTKENKKMISPEHVLSALTELGFEDYVNSVQEAYDNHKQLKQENPRKKKKLSDSGLSQEELVKNQQALFELSRLKMKLNNS